MYFYSLSTKIHEPISPLRSNYVRDYFPPTHHGDGNRLRLSAVLKLPAVFELSCHLALLAATCGTPLQRDLRWCLPSAANNYLTRVLNAFASR